MNNKRIFFQDFLFEDMPVDELDYPDIDVQFFPENADISNYKVVSLDTLLRMNKRSEWKALFKQTENMDVCIKDDVLIKNPEMYPYKRFYLETYYFNISKHSRHVYIL